MLRLGGKRQGVHMGFNSSKASALTKEKPRGLIRYNRRETQSLRRKGKLWSLTLVSVTKLSLWSFAGSVQTLAALWLIFDFLWKSSHLYSTEHVWQDASNLMLTVACNSITPSNIYKSTRTWLIAWVYRCTFSENVTLLKCSRFPAEIHVIKFKKSRIKDQKLILLLRSELIYRMLYGVSYLFSRSHDKTVVFKAWDRKKHLWDKMPLDFTDRMFDAKSRSRSSILEAF